MGLGLRAGAIGVYRDIWVGSLYYLGNWSPRVCLCTCLIGLHRHVFSLGVCGLQFYSFVGTPRRHQRPTQQCMASQTWLYDVDTVLCEIIFMWLMQQPRVTWYATVYTIKSKNL